MTDSSGLTYICIRPSNMYFISSIRKFAPGYINVLSVYLYYHKVPPHALVTH